MDQLKVFLRQCVKHRFWIAVGMSLLMPMIAYFLGAGPITEATLKAETEIKGAKDAVGKYTAPGIPNDQYAPIVKGKTEILAKDVDATWHKLYAQQEPLLRWPDVVEKTFREWGRKWPANTDRVVVSQALSDYTIAYPGFVAKIYKSFDPWDPDTGNGIVAAPPQDMLLKTAPFKPDAPPELGKVWAEQDRLWALNAALDVVKSVNDKAKAKDWDGAIIKQINTIEVGTPTAQDQVSIADGVALEPAKDMYPEGQEPPAEPAAGAEGGMGMPGMMGMMGMGGSGGPTGQAQPVFYVKTESTQFTLLPVMMNVLVDQNRLPEFMVGLENAPITIQLLEFEISKPAKPVEKPVYGQNMSFGYGMGGMGGMGMEGMMGMYGSSGGRGYGAMGGMGMPGMGSGSVGRGYGAMGGIPGMGMGMEGMYGGMGAGAAPAKGKDVRGVDKKAEREKKAKEAASKPSAKAKSLDPYYNVIEVTIYGQARFYNAPPPPAAAPESAGATTPAEPAPSAIPAAEAPSAVPPTEATPQPDAAKPETPKADAPKAEAPKADAPPADAPKSEPAKADASKPEPAAPPAPQS